MTGGRALFALRLYAAAVYVFLYTPIAMLIVLSFNDSNSITLPWNRFSLRWYEALADNPSLFVSLQNSLLLGVCTASVATTVGILAALACRRPFRGRVALMRALLLPLVIPGLTIGVALLLMFHAIGLRPGLLTTTLVAHVGFTLPYVFVLMWTRLAGFDRSLEEAAMDLGADEFTVFWQVTFPLIRPGVIGSALFAFTLSFDEFIRTLFTIGRDNTLPIQIWSMLGSMVSPELNAIATLIVLGSVVLVVCGELLRGRGGKAMAPRGVRG
jgi:ABC-type spermidine/putrescine transport system permease subunit II